MIERNLLTPSEIVDLTIIRDRNNYEDTTPIGGAAYPIPWIVSLNQTAAGGDSGIVREWINELGF